MAGNSSYCSPSRSSLSCCQADNTSQNDVCSNGLVQANNNYFLQEKHSFPKRPEIDLQFRDIRYRVKSWSIKSIKPGLYKILTQIITELLVC